MPGERSQRENPKHPNPRKLRERGLGRVKRCLASPTGGQTRASGYGKMKFWKKTKRQKRGKEKNKAHVVGAPVLEAGVAITRTKQGTKQRRVREKLQRVLHGAALKGTDGHAGLEFA